MMQPILTFHGNPGHSSDLDQIMAYFSGHPHLAITLPLQATDLNELFAAIDTKVKEASFQPKVVIAYSWGCWLACQWLAQKGHQADLLVLISPTLQVETPLSPLAAAVSLAPFVGDWLMAKTAKTRAEDFIQKTFAPIKADSKDATILGQQLQSAKVWQSAVRKKLAQQQHPLKPSSSPLANRVVVVRGSADTVTTWEVQERELKKIGMAHDKLVVHTIGGAGHALPWSHKAEITALLSANLAKPQATSSAEIAEDERTENNVISLLDAHLLNFPKRVALRWVDPSQIATWDGRPQTAMAHQEITYEQFAHQIARLAAGLAKLGITKGDRVILFLPMSVPMYAVMFAIQKLGAIAVFLDSWARRNHLGASAECVAPKAMISYEGAFALIREVPEFNSMPLRILAGPGRASDYTARLEDLFTTPIMATTTPVALDDTALITFTTGSSGTPKGANRTHRFLKSQHRALSAVIPYEARDSDMPAFPIFSLNNLATGVTTILPAIDLASPSERDAPAMVSQIMAERITCTTLSPSMFNNVCRFCLENGLRLDSLRRVITGGAPISRDNVAAFKQIAPASEIWILYGSTEVEPMAHIEAAEMLALAPDPDPDIIEDGVNVGHISEDLDYKFIRIDPEPIDLARTSWEKIELPLGEVGEFIVTGDHVCRDYYNNTEAFARAKIRGSDGRIWHRTGDLGRLDEKGYLWIVGRIHNAVERDGRYYFPVRAEVILKRLPFVRQGAFLGLPDPKLGNRTAVVIELTQDETISPARIAEIKRLFAKNQVPLDSLYVVEHIPMDPRHHSKVEYTDLKSRLLDTGAEDYLARQGS